MKIMKLMTKPFEVIMHIKMIMNMMRIMKMIWYAANTKIFFQQWWGRKILKSVKTKEDSNVFAKM